MGSNLARNLASREGNTVAVYNRSPEQDRALLADEHPEAGFVAVRDASRSSSRRCRSPRTAIIMVKAGAGTDAVIDAARRACSSRATSSSTAATRCSPTPSAARRPCARPGINFVGAGISGGEEGALNGPSIMPGGSAEAYETLGPILESIAAVVDGEPCVTHVGTDGAGHFVKMVHNGIEYADMQLIAEAYDLLRRGTGKTPAEIADVFAEWNKGELERYLIEITAEVLRQVDAETGKPLVDVDPRRGRPKGTGVWTVQTALDLGVPVSGIAEAVFARALSSQARRSAPPSRGLPGPAASSPVDGRGRVHRGRAPGALRVEDRRLLAGLRRDRRRRRASTTGTSTRATIAEDLARRLHHPRPVPQPHHRGVRRRPRTSPPLLTAPYFADAVADGAGRVAPRSSSTAAQRRHPGARRSPRRWRTTTRCAPSACPPRSSRASATSSARTPTSASTSDGTFHTLWSGDRSEIEPRRAPRTSGPARSAPARLLCRTRRRRFGLTLAARVPGTPAAAVARATSATGQCRRSGGRGRERSLFEAQLRRAAARARRRMPRPASPSGEPRRRRRAPPARAG